MAFMASAIGVGFLAGRFWMSSAEQADGQHAPGTQSMRTGGGTHAGMPRPASGTPVAGGAKPGFGAASTGE
jgi:hypothetical protein